MSVTESSPSTPGLEFAGVSHRGGPPYDEGVGEVTFALAPGRLILVRPGQDEHVTPWGDLATGMVEPATGSVRLAGRDWAAMPPDEVSRARAGIGRIFSRRMWISNLDLDENILLPWRYHTERTDRDLLAEADRLAQAFGLPEVPRLRPALAPRREQRLAGWIRAFMGAPRLLVLERPLNEAPHAALAPLARMVRERLDAGAAVLWVAGSDAEWNHSGLSPVLKIDVGGPNVVGG